MTTPMSSPVFAKYLADRLFGYSPTSTDVLNAKRMLAIRRKKRREGAGKRGHEYVVESLLRPIITDWTAKKLRIKPNDVPGRVNSSHYHSTDDPRWLELWTKFKGTYPDVDIHDSEGHDRRADLFVAMADGRLVSIDFKYVPPRHSPSVATCVRQLRLCLDKHEATILVIYSGSKPSPRLDDAATAIRDQLDSERAFVVTMVGPAIRFTVKNARLPSRGDGDQS